MFLSFTAQQTLLIIVLIRRNNHLKVFVAPGWVYMSEKEFVTKEEIESRINEAVQRLFRRIGLKVDPSEVKDFLAANDKLSPERQIARGIELSLQLGFGSFANKISTGIKTRQDLEKVLHTIGEATEQAPTLARGALMQILKNLARRGGPGRIAKLDAQESTKVCKEILQLIGQKHTVKEALVKTSEMCPTLLGKTVSPRTLQKAWDRRDEFLKIKPEA